MAKYNILVVTPRVKTGVEYHRQLAPHAYLRSFDDFEIATINEIESDSFEYDGKRVLMDDFLKQFQLVQFSRTLSYGWNMEKTAKRLKRLGVVSVLDIDDYWYYGKTHVLYHQHLVDEVPKKSLKSIKYADHVTTTTPYFADAIKPHKKNGAITVLENAINPNDPQFKNLPTGSDKIRFGWMGSQCHIVDVELLVKPIFMLSQLDLNCSIVYGGAVDTELGKFFKMVLSANGKIKNYSEIGWKDCFNYATSYNEIDVVLAPLVDNKFNNCKSEIKLIEAGFMNKGAMVSNVKPYTILGEDKKNCLMVDKDNWLDAFKYCIDNPNAVRDMGSALYESVKDKYHIHTVTVKRAQLYKHLIDNK